MRLLIVDEEIIAGGVDMLRRQLMQELARQVDSIAWVLPAHVADSFCKIASDCVNVTIETLNSPGGLARVREAVARRLPGGMPRGLVDERLRSLARRHQSDICMTTCAFGQEMPNLDLPMAGWVSDINPALPERIRDNIGKWVERAAMTFGISDFTSLELKRWKPGCAGKIYSIPLAGPGWTKPTGEVTDGTFYYPAAPNKHKNHLTLLEAARGLALRGMTYRLTLTGAGMDAVARGDGSSDVISGMRAFLAAHRELMEGRLVVAGDVGPAESERLFAEASCVVLPSSYEGFGLPLAEALGYGKRVICADIVPFREQIARHRCEDLATFVPPGNAAALEEEMARHLAGPRRAAPSPEELRDRLNQWTWADAARRCRMLLEGIAANG
jgi:glycosyltransferase involved in cell wall biosynthesis